jgi:predicted DNA-binding transcriptional regulator YafY
VRTARAGVACPRYRNDVAVSRARELRVLLQLARAQLTSRAARIRFRDTERSTIERTVDVLALAFEPPRWVVAAWARDRASLRVIDVARVLQVRLTRRRARGSLDGFDPVHFATRRLVDSGPVRAVTIRVEPRWAAVARVLLPTGEVAPDPGGGATVRICSSRPALVQALTESLMSARAIDSASPR